MVLILRASATWINLFHWSFKSDFLAKIKQNTIISLADAFAGITLLIRSAHTLAEGPNFTLTSV